MGHVPGLPRKERFMYVVYVCPSRGLWEGLFCPKDPSECDLISWR